MHLRVGRRRRGVAMVESAFAISLMLLMILGMVVVGVGVSRHQRVASLAREAARYASVHGASDSRATGQPIATASSVYANAILPRAGGLEAGSLSYSVTWDNASQGPVYLANASTNSYKTNYVNVTVSYQYQSLALPGLPASAYALTSTSRMPMAY